MATDGFRGFNDQGLAFLAGLTKHNDKPWFDDNRAAYDRDVLPSARAFVEAAGQGLSAIAPGIQAEPRINGSIFRLHRDTRFTKDKTPFKEYLDFWFWDSTDRRHAATGFYLRLAPAFVGVGVGAHRFDADQLDRYRQSISDKRRAAALVSAVEATTKAGFEVHGEHYKRPPKGIAEPTDPLLASLLRHNALWTGTDFPVPPSISSARFVSWCMTRWKKQAAVHAWLRDHVQ